MIPRISLLGMAFSMLFLSGAISANDDLPPDLQLVRQEVIDIASANTNRTDNIEAVRAELDPLIAELGTWFNENRPDEELALTQVPWQNLWFDDPDIEFGFDLGFVALVQDREQIYQVIEPGYYYNVSEIDFRIGRNSWTFTGFLKGDYQIIRPATPDNAGEPRLNAIDLEFVANFSSLGSIPANVPLSTLVQLVDDGLYPAVPVPGPFGVTGELWNVYIDDELRIAAGFDDSEPETIDLYILRKVRTAE